MTIFTALAAFPLFVLALTLVLVEKIASSQGLILIFNESGGLLMALVALGLAALVFSQAGLLGRVYTRQKAIQLRLTEIGRLAD